LDVAAYDRTFSIDRREGDHALLNRSAVVTDTTLYRSGRGSTTNKGANRTKGEE
jgi:hypothetical protein